MATPTGTPPAAVPAAPDQASAIPRWMPNFRSLRVQMALGSALVALMAVLVVSGIALAAVAVSFGVYQRMQLAEETQRMATALGQGRGLAGVDASRQSGNPLDPLLSGGTGAPTVWIMDVDGHIIVGTPNRSSDAVPGAQDQAVVTVALQRALQGRVSHGTLVGGGFPALTQRLYAAAPIYLGGTSAGPIIGAVALSTPLTTDRGAAFAGDVTKIILLAALGVAVAVAVAAAFFSRRVTASLDRLAVATARMARGDYGARVDIRSPDELHSLATSFNEMAAALERDVGELRRQEHLRRELVANVSHDLATPLTAIQGFTEALLDDVVQDPAERVETTRVIAREAARLRRLVDQLRQVALYEAGARALDRRMLRLSALVDETLAVLAPEMERKQITVVSVVPADLPPVFADDDRLTEVLLNLLDNALRHTPDGGRIEVAGTVQGQFVRVTVADSGPGIPAADREHIFERFYRVDQSRSSATGGSGLGLAIVRALVEAHGGAIHVGERTGGGAEFSFTLPIYTAR